MKLSEFRKLISEEVRNVLNTQKRVRTFESFLNKENQYSLNEATTEKEVLGVKFNIIPAKAGMKFEFKNSKEFRKSGITVNELVAEIIKMLDNKFGKGTFAFIPAGRDQTDPSVNGLEFRMNVSNFFKDL